MAKFTNEYGTYSYKLFEPKWGNGNGIVFAPGSMSFKEWYDWVGDLSKNCWHVMTISLPWQHLTSKDPRIRAAGILSGAAILRDLGVQKVVGAGHSMGGNGALLAGRELDGVAALAPGWPGDGQGDPEMVKLMQESALHCHCPSLMMVGSLDGVTGVEASVNHFDALPATKLLDIIVGGNHIQFMDNGPPAWIGGLFDNSAEIDHDDQLKHAKSVIVDWFKNI